MLENQSYLFCVAPMMDGTDRHCRYFHRLLTKRARLYTEMVTADAILHGDRERLLGFDKAEHPVALQLGGSEPAKLAEAARIGEGVGYDEINLNVGCPSDRVQSGAFGACLMKTPKLVGDCVAAMRAAVSVPVTVKCRIGVDDQDPEESLFHLVEHSAAAGCEVFIVHARKAWLEGLSPKENREVPPLDYGLVKRLKRERPHLKIVLNGGLTSIDECLAQLGEVDGVMLGRAAYGEPRLLADVDARIFGERVANARGGALRLGDLAAAMDAYLRAAAARGVKPHHVTRHMQGLAHGLPGAREWRRMLTERGAATEADVIARAWAVCGARFERALEEAPRPLKEAVGT
ncbi:MAG: tRNA dihydrouridine(20/20a) synthase DusA [Pseudomonadota bacterium]